MAEAKVAGTGPCVQKVEPGTYWWCACGKSAKQPFCDGSHKGSEFTPVRHEVAEATTVAWCLCKQTGTAPRCDGSHATLSPQDRP
ncbi:MAG: CDGSH iron-sulfur domain-containing protein [Akkermansiaceae bacterium]|nr:CDGSH iron-sulfur domain-containing protein [Akkermansiaceae bacterium]NNM29730.1 CDGSH iron-sulfur domain-containing protein [Akkermansiaceae bacterium]